jgi:tetratricopeptide (TPR) repeat protein
MFEFLKRLFGAGQETIADPDDTPEEYWQTDFHKAAAARFRDETGDSYAAKLTANGLALNIDKKNVYAWTVDPVYRYRDFVLEALVEFFPDAERDGGKAAVPRAGSMAAGFLFRYLTESTFYSVLLSDEGLVRMDTVINGTPVPILGWTETKRAATEIDEGEDIPPYVKNPSVFSIRIIAQATNFSIIVNDNWIASCSDDTIQAAGRIAFAAQNWNETDRAGARVNAIAIDSRSIEVETVSTRWNQYIKIPGEAHINLARTWYAMGKYVPAILELKRAWKDRDPETEELLLSGQVYLAQRLLPEAEEQIRKVLALDASHEDACAELGGILYLQNRFVELDDLLKDMKRESIEKSSFLSNLEGHLLHWKGKHAEAAAAYRRAGTLNGEQGLFFLHEGNEYELAGEMDNAVEAWFNAARVFLAGENYEDLASIVENLEKAAPDDPRVPAIAGKYLYATGDEEKAAKKLAEAIESGTEDSAVRYLAGMLHAASNDTERAIAELKKAVEMEPSYGPYRFRLAETLFFAGENCDEEIAQALEADRDNGWVYNLAALKALGEGDAEKANDYILEARRLLPHELPVLVNFAEISRQRGMLDEALPFLDQDDADSLRAGANLLVEERRFEEADGWYVRALKLRPTDAEILTDRAANCLELELLNEADDLLGRAIDITPSPRIYQLVSFLAGRKGEFARSEIALIKGLEDFPEDPDLLHELASVYVAMKKTSKAAEILKRLAAVDSTERTSELEEEIADLSTTKISCGDCKRTWRVPKDIPPQGSLHLTAEPPDDLPAGTCPDCMITYCIGCAKETLGEDGRFRCKKCGKPLKLIEQNVIWLLNEWQKTL